MDIFIQGTSKISIRINELTDYLIPTLGLPLIGKNKTKSDFINEAIDFYFWVLLLTLTKDIQKQINVTIIDDAGKKHNFDFNDLIKFFKEKI